MSGVRGWLPLPEHFAWGSTAGTLVAAVGGSGGFSGESECQRACRDLLERAERGAGGVDITSCNSDNPKTV